MAVDSQVKDATQNGQALMLSLLERYKEEIDSVKKTLPGSENPLLHDQNHHNEAKASMFDNAQKRVVLLTGSTGRIGCYILDELLKDNSISHIYCFNRSPNSRTTQKSCNVKRNLLTELPETKVTFLEVDSNKSDFGLTHGKVLRNVTDNITHIIHNAWPVNSDLLLTAFEPSLTGLLNLASLAARTPKLASLLFLSSTSSVRCHRKTVSADLAVPEQIISEIEACIDVGYSQSKLLGELLLDYAAQKLRFKAAIVRIGQVISTSEHECLNDTMRHQWLPRLITTSASINALPHTLGNPSHGTPFGSLGSIDWIAVDKLACVIVELSQSLDNVEVSTLQVFHAVSPRPMPWMVFIPAVQGTLESSGAEVRILPYEEWCNLLREESYKLIEHDDTGNHASIIQTLDLYGKLSQTSISTRFATTRTAQCSETLAQLEPVRPDLVSMWVKDLITIKTGNDSITKRSPVRSPRQRQRVDSWESYHQDIHRLRALLL